MHQNWVHCDILGQNHEKVMKSGQNQLFLGPK